MVGTWKVEWLPPCTHHVFLSQEIMAFIRQEERRGASLADQVKNDPDFQPILEKEPHLLQRIGFVA